MRLYRNLGIEKQTRHARTISIPSGQNTDSISCLCYAQCVLIRNIYAFPPKNLEHPHKPSASQKPLCALFIARHSIVLDPGFGGNRLGAMPRKPQRRRGNMTWVPSAMMVADVLLVVVCARCHMTLNGQPARHRQTLTVEM